MSTDVLPSNSFKSHLNLDFFEAMAKRSDAAPARWRQPFLGWLEGIERGWGIPALIVGFAATWMLFLTIAYLSGDLHPDVLETWSVGRSFAWGNAKHPPLMGWVAHLWTQVFPLTDWSFRLLAMTNAAVALWAVDLIARRFVRGDKRVVVLLLLMLLPTYQFHAQRFNANAVLLATGQSLPIASCVPLRLARSYGPLPPAQQPRSRCWANTTRCFLSAASASLRFVIHNAALISVH